MRSKIESINKKTNAISLQPAVEALKGDGHRIGMGELESALVLHPTFSGSCCDAQLLNIWRLLISRDNWTKSFNPRG
jgi:hypothetical protein